MPLVCQVHNPVLSAALPHLRSLNAHITNFSEHRAKGQQTGMTTEAKMIFVTCIALFLWGTTYAVVVAKWLPRIKRVVPGATAGAVVVGVLPIIGAVALVDGLAPAGRLFLFFACAGLAMIIGSAYEDYQRSNAVGEAGKQVVEEITK